MSRIEIQGLTQQFKGHRAVDSIDLTVEDGDFVVLLGPSGCGKTTLLRMIAGLLQPTSGTILIDGRDVTDLPSKKRNLAMVFQSYALYPHLNVEKNLAFPLTVLKMPKAEKQQRVLAAARSLGIEALLHRKPRELSGGQRQRVAVGRALVREPSAYLMDEPLSNLDAKLRTNTRQELSELHDRLAATFIYVTHDQVEAMTMATKIVVLNAGRIEQIGTPTQVYDAPASVFVAGFVGAPPMNLVDGTLSSHDGYVHATSIGITSTLWPGHCDDHEVTIGFRAEHLRFTHADTGAVRLNGIVHQVENLGSEQVVYVRVGDQMVVGRGGRELAFERGQRFIAGVDVENVHIFDRASGRRMEWTAEPAVAAAGALAGAGAR